MKRILAYILVFAVCFSAMTLTANAADSQIKLASEQGLAGEEVVISVSISGNPGLAYLKLKVGYDQDALTLVSTENTGVLSGTYTTSKTIDTNPYVLQWMAAGNSTNDGVVATIRFQIQDTAKPGDYAISLSVEECYDEEFEDVVFSAVPGAITVATPACSHTTKTEVPTKSADCVNSGNNMYYICASCGQAFQADGVTETTVEAETIPALGHDMSAATCTEVASCQRVGCSYAESSALGHSFTSYTSNGDATCTADGTMTAKCDRCDATDTITDVGSAMGHNYADATCTAPKTCKVCGATEGAPLGHSFTNYVANGDASCTADGTKTATCDRCIATNTVADAGSAAGHSFTNYTSNGDTTCLEDGTKTATCDGCGAVDTVTDVGSATGHDYADATCTLPKTCKICGTIEGSALGHSYTETWEKGEEGHWRKCAACGSGTDVAAHDYGSDGDVCIVCGYERTHVHRLSLVPAVEATCTSGGNRAYYTCSGCENWFEDGSGAIVMTDKSAVIIGALGHDLREATCTEAPYCQRKDCGYIEGSALGHSFTNYVSNNDASCTADGTKTAKCDRCDVTDTATDIGSTTGHDYADATCTAPKTCKVCGVTGGEPVGHRYEANWSKGEDGHWHECSVCGDEIDFAAHDYGSDGDECIVCGYERTHVHRLSLVSAVEATCTSDGNKAYYTCSGCENWFEDASGGAMISDKASVVISALGHDMSDATCTEAPHCEREGCEYTKGSALGHSFTNYVSNDNATCMEDGTKTAKCDRCDVTDTITDASSAKGHDFADATCSAPKTCKVCGVTEGDPLGHNYATTWSKGENGHWHECSACGDKTAFDAHDYGNEGSVCLICEYERVHVHKLILVPGVDATCTEDGNKAYYTCSGCENWFEDVSGSIVITDKTTVVISALSHDMTEATCTEASHCKRQGCNHTVGTALDHADENADKKCDRCGVSMGTDRPATPDKPTDDVPKTGDISKTSLWAMLLILSIAGTIICIFFSKKRNAA